jgi:Skp family chaperone for outer membrane proteins
MNMPRSLLAIAVLAATAGLAFVPAAPAQAAATGADALGGKPVPGVCLLSREAVFANAKVGQAASQHLKQLADQAKAQLDNQRAPLQKDVQDFQKKAPSLSEAQRKQQGEALQQRMESFQNQAGELNERIQLTRSKVMQRIGAEAEPVVAGAYKSHGCGLLLNRDAVLGGNVQNDLTADVIQGLDRKITTMSFNLEPLPKQSGK